MKEFMPMPLTVRIILAPIIFIPRIFGYRPYDGLYKGEHCRKYADKLIGTKDAISKTYLFLMQPFVLI